MHWRRVAYKVKPTLSCETWGCKKLLKKKGGPSPLSPSRKPGFRLQAGLTRDLGYNRIKKQQKEDNMKIQDIIEPARHLPFKIMITDPASKHAMEEVKNPYSGESCQLPRYAVAVYDTIKGAEVLEDGATMRKGIEWFQKWFTDQYYTLLD